MATQDILNERQNTHGQFYINAEISRRLKDTMHDALNWPVLSHVQKEALDVIQAKVARILSGNPNEPDHWADIAGYAELAHQDLQFHIAVIAEELPQTTICTCKMCKDIARGASCPDGE